MIYILISVFFLLTDKSRKSISKFLFLMLLVSSVSAYMVGRQPTSDFETQFCTLYSAILLCVLFRGFKNYANLSKSDFTSINEMRLLSCEKIITVCNLIAFVINIYIIIHVFSSLVLGIINVQTHKNEGGAGGFFAQLVPHYVLVISYLFSPLGYLSLSLHFFYLVKGHIKKSVQFFFLSLTIVLAGLVALSRSATVLYIIVYIIIFIFIFPLVSKRIRTKIMIFVSFFCLMIFLALFVVSSSRFSSHYSKKSINNSIIDESSNPFFYSTLDYFSQWEENGAIILKAHTPDYIFFGLYNSSGIGYHVATNSYNKIQQKMAQHLGDRSNSFHGVIASLVYDYGFIGTIFFIFLYAYIEKHCGPTDGTLYFKTIFFLPVVLPLCAIFFGGNILSSLALNLAIIYSFFFYSLIKKRTVNIL